MNAAVDAMVGLDPTAGGACVAPEEMVIVNAAGMIVAGFPTRHEAVGALERFLSYDPDSAEGCRVVPVRRRSPGAAPAVGVMVH